MRKLIYSLSVSLDGFIEAPGRNLDWSMPSDELHRHHNEKATEDGLTFYGRGLWEAMVPYWPSVLDDPDADAVSSDFAKRWVARPKVLFSSTVTEVDWNTRLHRGDPVAEIERLKATDGGSMDIGGATLGSTAVRAGLVDEYWLYYFPVALGAGTPFFRDLTSWVELRLVETKTFDGGVVLLRYEKKK
ncbi:dihydrofolate reductase family protein [Actinophytocola sediminis]